MPPCALAVLLGDFQPEALAQRLDVGAVVAVAVAGVGVAEAGRPLGGNAGDGSADEIAAPAQDAAGSALPSSGGPSTPVPCSSSTMFWVRMIGAEAFGSKSTFASLVRQMLFSATGALRRSIQERLSSRFALVNRETSVAIGTPFESSVLTCRSAYQTSRGSRAVIMYVWSRSGLGHRTTVPLTCGNRSGAQSVLLSAGTRIGTRGYRCPEERRPPVTHRAFF